MAPDSMEKQVLLRNSTLLILLCCTIACQSPKHKSDKVPSLYIEEGSPALNYSNGIVFYKGSLYSGFVFAHFPNSKDTAFITGYWKGKENGFSKKWHENGQLKESRWYKNGLKTGEYAAYWPNGQKLMQFYCINDEYDGTFYEWAETGALVKSFHYKKGYEEGLQQLWYDNGKIRANYFITQGRRYGLLGTKNCTNVSDSIFK